MKRISILACILGVCFVSTAWAQQPATKPPIARSLQHRMANQTSRTPGLRVSLSFNAQANRYDAAKVWELGTYPGGTWFATWHINDLGVIVGLGDVPPIGRDGIGYTHTLAVPLFGPKAGEWIDVGALSRKQPKGWEEPFNDISNTGLVVSHSTARGGHMHGVAWTKETGMVDLGTLADTGDREYSSYNLSAARVTNKLGTLIGGVSGVDGNPISIVAPVVWTPANVWMNGKFVTKWQIHKLDTSAFPDLPMWDIFGVNEDGQIIGIGFDSVDITIGIPALWNPRTDGKGWEKLTPLPPSPAYPQTWVYGINGRGEIIGTQTLETETVRFNWPEFALEVGDTVELSLLNDGEGDAPSAVRRSSESPKNLFSHPELASELLSVVSAFESRLMQMVDKSKNTESADEHKRFTTAVGHVLAQLGDSLLHPIYRQHKELVPDELKGELL